MRLLRAELGKLRRPLSWAVAGAAIVFCVLLAVGGAHNAMGSRYGSRSMFKPPTCFISPSVE